MQLCACMYMHVSKVGGALSKQCGCQFETHPDATSFCGYMEHQFKMCYCLFKMKLLNLLKGQLTLLPPLVGFKAVGARKGDSSLRSAKRSSRCEGMQKRAKKKVLRGTEVAEAAVNILLHFSTCCEKT